MSKLFSNVNWSKVGNWFGDVLKTNSGRIVGALAMIGLGLLCKKLDVPVEVLSDPFSTINRPKPKTTNSVAVSMLYMPKTSKENAIATIAKNVDSGSLDCHKLDAVKKIYSLAEDASESEKNYAISAIGLIMGKMSLASNKGLAEDYITQLGKT